MIYYKRLPDKYYIQLQRRHIGPTKRRAYISLKKLPCPLVKILCCDEIFLVRADDLEDITGVKFDGTGAPRGKKRKG